jgi:hypothetical protein
MNWEVLYCLTVLVFTDLVLMLIIYLVSICFH